MTGLRELSLLRKQESSPTPRCPRYQTSTSFGHFGPEPPCEANGSMCLTTLQ